MQPFDDLAGLSACNGRAVAVASNSTSVAGLLEIDLRPATPLWSHSPAMPAPLSVEDISVAEPLWFNGLPRTNAPMPGTTPPAATRQGPPHCW